MPANRIFRCGPGSGVLQSAATHPHLYHIQCHFQTSLPIPPSFCIWETPPNFPGCSSGILISWPPVFFGERSLFFCHTLQDLSSQTGIAPRAMAVKARSPNHWPAREFSREKSLQPVKGTKPQLRDSRRVPLQEIHQELPSLCSPAVQASKAPVNTPSALMYPLGYSEDKHHPLPFHYITPPPGAPVQGVPPLPPSCL